MEPDLVGREHCENVVRKRDAEGNLLAISIFNLSSFARTRPRTESTSDYGVWALFNLDVDDGETFDFDETDAAGSGDRKTGMIAVVGDGVTGVEAGLEDHGGFVILDGVVNVLSVDGEARHGGMVADCEDFH